RREIDTRSHVFELVLPEDERDVIEEESRIAPLGRILPKVETHGSGLRGRHEVDVESLPIEGAGVSLRDHERRHDFALISQVVARDDLRSSGVSALPPALERQA